MSESIKCITCSKEQKQKEWVMCSICSSKTEKEWSTKEQNYKSTILLLKIALFFVFLIALYGVIYALEHQDIIQHEVIL